MSCSTPQHVAGGNYDMILIEPEGDLPGIDKEIQVMQGDMYADGNSDPDQLFSKHEQTIGELTY
jgi:hypothetical protein